MKYENKQNSTAAASLARVILIYPRHMAGFGTMPCQARHQPRTSQSDMQARHPPHSTAVRRPTGDFGHFRLVDFVLFASFCY